MRNAIRISVKRTGLGQHMIISREELLEIISTGASLLSAIDRESCHSSSSYIGVTEIKAEVCETRRIKQNVRKVVTP
jgi:hypothetical protein